MKINLPQTSVILAVICAATLSWAGERIENQIASFNLMGTPITESQFIHRFGQGYTQENKINKRYTYYIPDNASWIEIRFSHTLDKNFERFIESILITRKKLCDETYEPKEPFGSIRTSKGIKLGDAIEKVTEIYGAPTISIQVGKTNYFSVLREELNLQHGYILRYLSNCTDELLFNEYYFDNSKLHSLLISISE